jgi:heme exporter protein C
MKKTDVGFYALLGITLVGLLALIAFVFLVVPPAQVQAGGVSQKILYFHAPSAWAMYLSGIVCFVGSAGYLLRPTDKRNALAEAGAECASIFGLIVLTTGPLWNGAV